jgi:hypothetical protein
MEPSRDISQNKHGAFPEDDLSRLIRWSFEDLSKAEPPEGAWSKILSRVRKTGDRRHLKRRAKRSVLPLAPLLQAVVISVLLLAFSLELDRNVATRQTDGRPNPTPVIQRTVAPDDQHEDVLRGHLLARWAREARFPKPRSIPKE